MTDPQPDAIEQAEGIPVGRTVLTVLLLRRLGLLPIVALALAGRHATPARRRRVVTVAAAVYLAALAVLVALVLALVGGLAVVALTA